MSKEELIKNYLRGYIYDYNENECELSGWKIKGNREMIRRLESKSSVLLQVIMDLADTLELTLIVKHEKHVTWTYGQLIVSYESLTIAE